MIRRPPSSTLFPYTPLSRSEDLPLDLRRQATVPGPPPLLVVVVGDQREVRAEDDPVLVAQQLRSEEHTSELQSPCNLVCRLLLEKKKKNDVMREIDANSSTV